MSRIVALVATLLAVSSTASAFEASVVPATRKVVPGDKNTYTTWATAELAGCRNEWESFQVVIRTEGTLTGVNAAMTDLAGPSDSVIPASAAHLYREWFLKIENPSGGGISVKNHMREPGLYPDPLIPFVDPYSETPNPVGAPFDIGVNDNGLAVVFVDIHIPDQALPGTYLGTLAVTAEGQDPIAIPVELAVWELDMPNEKNIGTAFRMSDSQVRRYHGGPDEGATSADFDRILKNYYVAAQDHRIDPTGFKGPVDFQFDGDGVLLPVDWTAYDAYMAPYIDGSYFPNGVGVARFDVGMFGPGRGRTMDDEQYKQAAAALANHLDQKGWWHKAWVYSKDEPWLTKPLEDPSVAEQNMMNVANDSRLLVESSDLWKGHILVTGPKFDLAAEWVGIWCPVQPMYDSWFWTEDDYPGRGDYDAHVAGGGELWFYNCNGNMPPYPGYDIDTTIGYEPRILKWGSWYEGATGYLYWRLLYWGDFDPWVEWQDIPGFGPFFARNGDGLLMYPGDGDGTFADARTPEFLSLDGPIVSYRMKQIRDGLEDWEMFIMAEKAGIGDWVKTEIGKVYRRFGNFMELDCERLNYYCPEDEPWTLDEGALLQVRSRIAAKLLFTLYPDRYPDPDEPAIPEVVESGAEITETIEDIAELPGDVGTGDSVTDDTTDSGEAQQDAASDAVQGSDLQESGRSGCAAGKGSTRDLAAIPALILAAAVAMLMRRKKAAY